MKDWATLASVLLDAAGDHVAEQGSPVWIRVLDPPEGDAEQGFALALSDESQGLLGWVATPDCQAVGLVATGRLRSVAGATAVGADVLGRHGDHLRLACLVTRDGEMAWKTQIPDKADSADLPEHPPTEGRMLDCLRRCFGLPTPPPPVGPARLQAIAWLVAVFDRAIAAPGRLTWFEVSRLHPVAQVLNAELGGPRADVLPGLLRVAGSAWTWEDFRQQAERDGGLEHLVEPSLAGWMDHGMFARWILSEVPSLDELLAAVRPHLVPSAARRLAHAVHESGLPDAAGACR
jgi:hypothetical protein